MSHWATRLARTTILGLVAEILAQAANTIFFIIITRMIGEFEAGAYALGFTFAAVLLQSSLGGLNQFLLREGAARPEDLRKIVGQCLTLKLLSSVVCYGFFMVWLIGWGDYSGHDQLIFYLIAGTAITESLIMMYQAYMIVAQRIEFTVLISAVSGLLKLVGGSLALILGGDAVVTSMVVLGSSLGALVCYMIISRRYLPPVHFGLSLEFWREHWRKVLPFFVIGLLVMIEVNADTLLLARRLGPQAVGIYNAATGLMAGVLLLPRVLRLVLLPIVTRCYVEAPDEASAVTAQILRVVGGVSVIIGVSLVGVADHIIRLFYKDHFGAAVPVLQVLALTFIVVMLTIPSGRLLVAAGRQHVFVRMQLASTICTIALNLLLQPRLGALGAAWADFAGAVLIFVLIAGYIQYSVLRWPLFPALIRLVAATTPCVVSLYAMQVAGLPWQLALLVSWLVYAMGLWIFGVITVRDVAWVQQLLAQRAYRPAK